MTLIERLHRWHAQGKIPLEQHTLLAALVRREHFSVFFELNALLYLGVVAFVGGLGWTVQTHFERLGDAAILSGLGLIAAASFSYCLLKAPPFSTGEVRAASFTLDYVLYLGCLVYGVGLSYLEFRYHILAARWDIYLLVSAVLAFLLAYRFDNRFVLSLALSTLGAWVGVKISDVYKYGAGASRFYFLAYGVLTVLLGWGFYVRGLKRHFLETYLHIAALVILITSVYGIPDRHDRVSGVWEMCLLAGCSAAGWYGVRFRQFAFVAYAAVFGYIGASILIFRDVLKGSSISITLLYFVISGMGMVAAMTLLARRYRGEP